ncbi:MAG: ATP-binding cassette domain-containing protein [Rhodobacteraceae bacterium]|nr:ATP-binding cassette domain-containing protein [Paracoccaceae bacterium]
MTDRNSAPALDVRGLNVFYGASHALQGVDLTLPGGVLSVVGRNGMGKTTLCKTIMGLIPARTGSINFDGTPLLGRDPGAIARMGIAYVPQGRRLWPSLTVDEHLKMLASGKGSWTPERIYDVFPRLAERKQNGGGQLSGGEQQMLAIARALLSNPRLLIMDEPTEGLAPVIVDQVTEMLISLAAQGEMDILVIEQNIGVATSVSDTVAIMLNGRINRLIDATRLSTDIDLQQSLLGVGRHAHDDDEEALSPDTIEADGASRKSRFVYMSNPAVPTRWSRPASVAEIMRKSRPVTAEPVPHSPDASLIRPHALPSRGGLVLVAGTMDTKARELTFIRDILRKQGLNVRTVDLSTREGFSAADFPAHEIAASGRRGRGMGTDRGQSVAAMSEAFRNWISRRNDIAGIISAGGSGGTALATPAMRELPVGVPKVMISTVAAGDVGPYVSGSDITMINAVADIQGLNRITRQVLANGANALGGMVRDREREPDNAGFSDKPVLGLTMFGITTPCVTHLTEALDASYECLVFHATGSGGRSMEALAEHGIIGTILDITTTEIADMIAGGVLAADESRLDVLTQRRLPYLGSCGALDTVNFGAPETVPERFSGRVFYQHNPQVTLMRSTAEECREMGLWIGNKLNQMQGPVRFFLPEGGLSALDAPGQPFHDPVANEALFQALEEAVHETSERLLVRVPHHINSAAFAKEVTRQLETIAKPDRQERRLAHATV